ncbi:MAG TPA: hypothetical protein VMQ65_07615 [Candidatus Limnocylindria bacterium]|nr:hypothetical protein [Candidatus Limnocylindria bacterium]
MTIQGRSLDDLPLAAYTTRVEPDPGLEASEVATPTTVPPGTAMPPIDAAALAALPLADGEPDRDAAKSSHVSVPVGRPLPGLPALPEWLAHPRQNLREPRLLLSGVVGSGLVLLVLSLLLGGGGAAGLGPVEASPSAPAFVATAPPPAGNASVDVAGKLAGTHELIGATGSGPAVASRIDATWSSSAGATLGLTGAASPGTRTTDATFVLTWTVIVDEAQVTFTSDSGECTVGMAVQPKAVSGSFVCKKLRSDDGKQTLDARGTYRT